MIPAKALAEVFRSMLGWPYATPGSNDQNGVDCSGAFVYAYRQFGRSIYHGSNRIVRRYCHDVRKRSQSELEVGMAIFKSRTDLSRMKAEYKKGGRYYDPALPDDYYHVGLVVSVQPLQIVNATPPRVRIDTALSPWCCAGYLNAVDYNADCAQTPATATVYAPSGSTVNLRSAPSLSAVVRVRVPIGETVAVLAQTSSTWWQVRWNGTTGYMMSEFLIPDSEGSARNSDGESAPAPAP